MRVVYSILQIILRLLSVALLLSLSAWNGSASGADAPKSVPKVGGPPPVPVRVAAVEQRTVFDQIFMIGTTEAIATSTVAAQVSGLVEYFPVKAGDSVKKGQLLARLGDTEPKLRLKTLVAERERVRANLENAKKELERLRKLRETNSVAGTSFDTAYYVYLAFTKSFQKSQAEIDYLEYDVGRKKVYAPFSGRVSKEHTQVGQWIIPGGPVVTLMDLANVLVTADVPERFAVKISSDAPVRVLIRSVSEKPIKGVVYAMLPQGDPEARTLPVRVKIHNPDGRIRAGMEARVTFSLSNTKSALLVPKDAVVADGDRRTVYVMSDGTVSPIDVRILSYHNGSVAVDGDLKPGMAVVIRGNERLRPGQAVKVIP